LSRVDDTAAYSEWNKLDEDEVEPSWSDVEHALMEGHLENPVQAYLHSIGQVALLSLDEERSLMRRVDDGTKAAQCLEAVCLEEHDPAAIAALQRQVDDGQQARDHVWTANLRLVVSIAKKHQGRGLSFLDLIQEGSLGLLRAIEKFDLTKGTKFSTYATWWIRQAVTRAIAEQSRIIRLPIHMNETCSHIHAAQQRLTQDTGIPPTAEDLARHLNIPLAKVRLALESNRAPRSLEQPVGQPNKDGDTTCLGNLIPDPADTQSTVEAHSLTEKLGTLLAGLEERQRHVVVLRFGLNGEPRQTLDQVGARLGNISRERVRQLERSALEHLRSGAEALELQDYLVGSKLS